MQTSIQSSKKDFILEIFSFSNVFSKKDFDQNMPKLRLNKKSILSFSQEPLWLLKYYEGGMNVCNVSIILRLNEEKKFDDNRPIS